MKVVEITYRYDSAGVMARPRPVDADAARRRLAYPPADHAGFNEFADAVVRSDRIAAFCAQGAG